MKSSPDRIQEELGRIRAELEVRHGRDTQELAGHSLPVQREVDRAAGLARINAHWGITSELPIIGRFLVLFRRSMRILLRWYINPIVEQQNRFNESVVRTLYEMQAEIDDLKASEPTRSREE